MTLFQRACSALFFMAVIPFTSSQELSELSCDDFNPTQEALERYPDLVGACEAIVERNGELYARFSAEVRRATNRSVTLHLPATDHTFAVSPDPALRVLVDGQKTRIRDLQRGQEIRIYLATSEVARPDIQEVLLFSDAEVLINLPVEAPPRLPDTASPLPLVGLSGVLLLGIAMFLRRRRLLRSGAVPVVLIGLAASLGSVSPEVAADMHGAKKPGRFVTSLIRTGAIVEKVDHETRELKLIDASGRRFTTRVDESVVNFNEIQPRDRIIMEYLESIAIVVVPDGSPELGQGMVVEVAEEGEKPGIAAVETVMVKAHVLKVNLSERRATLKFEDGSVDTIKVAEDTPLDLVSVGDEVRIRVTHAMAVTVRKVGDT